MTKAQNFPVDLQQHIEIDITSGKLKTGELFSLAFLGKQYGADVQNVSAVVPSLIRKGLVAKTGDQTIIICELPKAAIESVFQYAQKLKLRPRTVVRGVEVIHADVFLAEKLALTKGDPVYQQVRTRLVDEHVLANQYNFIPFGICPGLENVDLSRRSFQVTLEKQFHTVIDRIDETYSLGDPKRDDAQILGLKASSQVLIVERMSFSSSNMPLVFADIHVNPLQFHYVEQLWPGAAELVKSII